MLEEDVALVAVSMVEFADEVIDVEKEVLVAVSGVERAARELEVEEVAPEDAVLMV